MKRCIVSFIMVMCLCLMAGNNAKAEVENESITGITMTKEDFRNTFGVAPNEKGRLRSGNSQTFTEMKVSDFVVEDEAISFRIEMCSNNDSTVLELKGKLGASYKMQQGINSTIVEVTENTKGYEVLLFEIFNDNTSNNLLVSNELEGIPHIKIYLKDDKDNIYLFEDAMPNELMNINAEKFETADKTKDALWASELVEHETKELETSEEILSSLGLTVQSRALNSWTTWNNPTTYYDAFYIGADYVQCWSLPYVEYRHTNVTSQDSTWAVSFKVAEHMSVGGTIYYGNNVFEYRNLKLAFACGDKTTFMRTYQEGKLYDLQKNKNISELGTEITVYLFNKAVSALPYGSTFSSVIQSINSMSSARGEVCLGSTGISLSNRKTTAVGEKLDNYSFETCTNHSGSVNNGHYFTYQGVLQYESASGNTNTVGAITVEFDKFYTGDYSYTPVSKSFQLNYASQQ